MITKSTKLNNYGGNTWHIKLDSGFNIFIHGADV
jgi:hypothetical protein